MARPGGKWRKSYKHQQRKKPKVDSDVLKRRKNIASVQRAKEMQEYHRKHLLCVKSQQQQKKADPEEELLDELDAEEDEQNPYDELVSELAKNAPPMRSGVVSSSDDDDDDDGEEEEENENDGFDEEDDMDDIDVDEEMSENGSEETDNLDDEALSEEDEVSMDGSEVEDNDDDDQDVSEASEDETNAQPKSKANAEEPQSDENDEELDEEQEDEKTHVNDNFSSHLDYELSSDEVETLLASDNNPASKREFDWPSLRNCSLELPHIAQPKTKEHNKELRKAPSPLQTPEALHALGIKPAVANNVPLPLTQLQSEMLTLLNNYLDVFHPQRNFEHTGELRLVYCLHILNHMLKTRGRILHHNAKLTAAATAAAELESKRKKRKVKPNKADLIVPDNYRDQGLVRPKVLVVLPFRQAAYDVVSTFKQLLYSGNEKKAAANAVMHYDRFTQEYTGQTLHLSKTNPKPEDYERIFDGNTDDNFRIGMSLTKKCLKLYTDFYASDIIIASPLGLRMIVGAEGSKERDYDFLNSIELLIIDQTELMFAQNWENLLHIVDHLHLQPKSLRDADFQRVRPWCLSGLSRFYRQTLLLATHELPEFRALFNNKCCNYAGKLRVSNRIAMGSIRNVAVTVPQSFQRIEVTDLASTFDQRFRYFTEEVLPRYRNPTNAHCMIYVPSYFDYVRLRNYMKAETISYVQICEYTNKAKMARARDMFYHSGVHFMLYSERSHFYRRTRVKGIRHMIMYQPPFWPNFYAEMINLMHSGNQNASDGLEDGMTVTVLYTKYDLLQLKAILGSDAAAQLVGTDKSTHTFTAE